MCYNKLLAESVPVVGNYLPRRPAREKRRDVGERGALAIVTEALT